MEVRSSIDSVFLDEAEEEIFQLLLKQNHSYSDRWYSSSFITKVMSVLRIFGVSASIFGFALCVFVIWNKPAWCPVWVNIEYYTLTFLIFAVVFYFLPIIQIAIQSWGKNYAFKNCKKLARRCVKEARKHIPYIAVYKFEDENMSYSRVKDDVSDLAWSRKLKGVAYHGKSVTVFFRKWTSFFPTIIILHEDFHPIESVLTDLHIESRPRE